MLVFQQNQAILTHLSPVQQSTMLCRHVIKLCGWEVCSAATFRIGQHSTNLWQNPHNYDTFAYHLFNMIQYGAPGLSRHLNNKK